MNPLFNNLHDYDDVLIVKIIWLNDFTHQTRAIRNDQIGNGITPGHIRLEDLDFGSQRSKDECEVTQDKCDLASAPSL